MSQRLRGLFAILTAFMLVAYASDVSAQWKNLAPGLLGLGGTQDTPFGASAFKDGNLWFGRYELFCSTDLGKTWTNRTPTNFTNGSIVDIDFFDAFNGVVVTETMAVYLTSDAGQTWKRATIPTLGIIDPGGYSAFFMGSVQVIAASLGSAGLFVSQDAGATWMQTNVGKGVPKTFGRWIAGSTVYLIAEDASYVKPTLASSNRLFVSNDFGATWNPTSSTTYLDCWSFAVDSCDQAKVCIPNESATWSNFPIGDSSAIFTTTDLGATWDRPYTTTLFDICGSVVSSQNALFAQTSHHGVIRSIDHGYTWKSIKGPGAHWDTRYVVAANDNIIFAVDTTDGSVWGTFNSGGDSLALPQDKSGAILYATDSLFIGDSLRECDPEVTRVLRYYAFGCPPAQIGSIEIVDTTNYYYAMSGDSVFVTFRPHADGSQTRMILTTSGGKKDTVYLRGTVDPSKPLSMTTTDQVTDTIGGTVSIPIEVSGLDDVRDVELVIRYDPSLQYIGAFSTTGVALDIPGEQWPGHSKIRISSATSGVVLGHVLLNAFVDSNGAAHVDFDSVVVTNPNPPCEYVYAGPTPVRTNVTAPSGCGDGTISAFMRYGVLPTLTIRPNPAATKVRIEVDRSVGPVTIEIVDELGAVKRSITTELLAKTSKDIDVQSLPAGAYHLVVHSATNTLSSPLTIIR